MKRTVFFISDQTGITAETLGRSLLTQFEHIQFDEITLPFIDTPKKAEQAVTKINETAKKTGLRPIVFTTIVDQPIRDAVNKSEGFSLDFFNTFLGDLETELQTQSAHQMGRYHSIDEAYQVRMDAVNFALGHDDGATTRDYNMADVILVGVSRCGKTPTCLYLAMQFGIKAANYPMTEEDLHLLTLPTLLVPHRKKLFGLTIDPVRLSAIRNERRPGSGYASLERCQSEVQHTEKLFKSEKISFLNTTKRSIEEIATKIMAETGLQRHVR